MTHQIEWYRGEYGSFALASEYCGFLRCPRQCPGVWQHGWLPSQFNVHHEAVLATDGRNYESRLGGTFFVARQDQVEFLTECGFRQVRAIGLPIIYCPLSVSRRVPGSLLVVPVHSLSHSDHDWDFDQYADEVCTLRQQFSDVCVCVHGSCVEKGYWTKAFEKRGIRWIRGACHTDENSLQRITNIFSQFEFVTSNGFGSHLAYASALGCRVSLWGTMAKWDLQSFANDAFALNSPEAFSATLYFVSEAYLRQRYPDFFTEPRDAPLRVEWGRSEVGWDNRKSPEELKKIFGWDLKTRVMRAVAGRVRRVLGFSGG